VGQLRRPVAVLSFEIGEVLNEAFTQQLLHFEREAGERGLGLVHMRVKPQNRRRQLEACRGGLRILPAPDLVSLVTGAEVILIKELVHLLLGGGHGSSGLGPEKPAKERRIGGH
jgi:hypothetical protein